ncbi:hypothetical protein B0H11DRAFT_1737750 [Mycena galericulata]|nr:hypothetical protein B0H11DRAFT_1750547 [Mycena galericulata]KAJ7458709.1 hypothetical protein B0H11DRAFT_1737750 [Mycena galericulata]
MSLSCGEAESQFTLPRRLTRPQFANVGPALADCAPDVPPDFIDHVLCTMTSQMLAGIGALAPSHLPKSLSASHLPITLSVPLQESQSCTGELPVAYPTHALAVGAAKTGHSTASTLLLFPIHELLLAAHCTKLPRLPPIALIDTTSPKRCNLPVLPITLPSPQAFAILHSFMYDNCPEVALATLLPLHPTFLEGLLPPETGSLVSAALMSSSIRRALAEHLIAVSGGSLMIHVGHIKDLWHDMVALGVKDSELWGTLDLAWEVVLDALKIASAGQ